MKSLRTHLYLGLVSLTALFAPQLAGCSGDVGLIVSVEGIPQDSVRIVVKTTINGVPGRDLEIPQDQQHRFLVRLSDGQTGDLSLSAWAIDRTGCKVADGTLTASLTRGLKLTREGTLTLMPRQPALCPLRVKITPEGEGSVASSPPGMDCSASQCVGEFPRDAPVSLRPVPASYKNYAEWPTGCADRYGVCDYTVSEPAEIELKFRGRSCSRDGWCLHAPLDASGVPVGISTTATLRTLQITPESEVFAFGDKDAAFKCDALKCKKVPVEENASESDVTFFRSTQSNGQVWAIRYNSYKIFSYANEKVSEIADLRSVRDGCASHWFSTTSDFFADQGALWYSRSGYSNARHDSLARVSIANDMFNGCKYVAELPNDITDMYNKDGKTWIANKVPSVVINKDPPSLGPALADSGLAVTKVHGSGSDVWFLGGSGLLRCSAPEQSCPHPVKSFPSGFTGGYLFVSPSAVWSISNDGAKAALLPGHGSSAFVQLSKKHTEIPVHVTATPTSRQWLWANESALWLAAGSGRIERCTQDGCDLKELPSSSVSIYAIEGSGTDVWAVGNGGAILHYRPE